VHRDISVSLFVSVVFGNVMQIIAPDHNGSLHLGGDADALEDLASDRDVASEGAFLIYIFGFDSLLRSFESQSDILVKSNAS